MKRQSESIAKLAQAFVQAQAELDNVTASSVNPHFRSNYADLATILTAVKPVLAKFKLAVLQTPTVDEQGRQNITTTLLHESGEYIEGDYLIIAKDLTDPQKIGSGVTYARRYSLNAILNIASEDDDGTGAAAKPAPAAPAKPAVTPKSKEAPKVHEGAGKGEQPSPLQLSKLADTIKEYNIDTAKMRAWILKTYSKPVSQCTVKEYDETMAFIGRLGQGEESALNELEGK